MKKSTLLIIIALSLLVPFFLSIGWNLVTVPRGSEATLGPAKFVCSCSCYSYTTKDNLCYEKFTEGKCKDYGYEFSSITSDIECKKLVDKGCKGYDQNNKYADGTLGLCSLVAVAQEEPQY